MKLPLVMIVLVLTCFSLRPAEAATWNTNGPMTIARFSHTATLLQNGKVLLAGGRFGAVITNSAELYDPATGKCVSTGAMNSRRANHTATLLPNGRVLVAGGLGPAPQATAETFDPISGQWTNIPVMAVARDHHTATLLPDGRVIVAGGTAGSFACAELFDTLTQSWSLTGELNVPRTAHTATLLTNGLVLVVGGQPADGHVLTTESVEVFDPSSGNWSLTNELNVARSDHTATLLPSGLVFVAGGTGGTNFPSLTTLTNAEIYDPASGNWTVTNVLLTARAGHSATLLPNGRVLLAGGQAFDVPLSTAEVFDPIAGTNGATVSLVIARSEHTGTLLPSGRVFVAGGLSGIGATPGTEVLDWVSGSWTNLGSSALTSRYWHTATLLPSGKVLIAGGDGLKSAALYDPVMGAWSATASLTQPRSFHTATLLGDGNVLVTGGSPSASYSTAELYNPSSSTWSNTGVMNFPRARHTASLLPNGMVLIAGGGNLTGVLATAELYNPASGVFTSTGSMVSKRRSHSATVLSNAKVLVAGGHSGTSYLASAELYDLATGKWTPTGSFLTPREPGTATLLLDGRVLIAGGYNGSGRTNADLYNPFLGTWSPLPPLSTWRDLGTATLLANGLVLVAGGADGSGNPAPTADLFDPALNNWLPAPRLTTARFCHTSVLMPNGKALMVGGLLNGFPVQNAETFSIGLGFSNQWQPVVSTITSPLDLGSGLVSTGSQFRGCAQASGGNTQDSSTDYPLVQLRSIESGQTMFLQTTNWSTNSFTSLPVWNFPPGWAMVTVFVNGIPSTSSIVNITVPTPTETTLTDLRRTTNGAFQFAFTNAPGAVFGVLTSTNVALPMSNWTALGGVTEVSPGQFQFTDPQAATNEQRFYRVRAP